MDGGRDGIRKVDVALAVAAMALGALMMWDDVRSDGVGTRIDSHTWWMLPVFLVACGTVLVWRRRPEAALGVAIVVIALHDVAFGHLVRCGAGLPLAFLWSYLAGYGAERRRSLRRLTLCGVLSAAVLVFDTAAGPSVLPVVLAIQVVLWGIGQVVRSRVALTRELRERNRELARVRDERTALEVAGDRRRVSRQLEALLEQRLGLLERLAEEAEVDDPVRAQALLEDLELNSRRTLDDMRGVVGSLRGGDLSLAPSPSVAHLDALLGRHVRTALSVTGDPRVLPASVELSAYRIVEHLLTVLADDRETPVRVALAFRDAALEITVTGPVSRGSDVRGAVARARERALLHTGRLDSRMSHGQASVVALLPVLAR